MDFLSADAIHLFADDGLDLVCDLIAEREQGEKAGGDRTAVAAADEIDMGDGLRVSRGFFEALSDEL